jgi:hypothetical protein
MNKVKRVISVFAVRFATNHAAIVEVSNVENTRVVKIVHFNEVDFEVIEYANDLECSRRDKPPIDFKAPAWAKYKLNDKRLIEGDLLYQNKDGYLYLNLTGDMRLIPKLYQTAFSEYSLLGETDLVSARLLMGYVDTHAMEEAHIEAFDLYSRIVESQERIYHFMTIICNE